MEYETAGDPMSDSKWSRKTTEKISKLLVASGLKISKNTVGRLLKQLGFSLRVNHKIVSTGTKCDRTARNEQFSIINQTREAFVKRGDPVISVDTKKKELIGNFKNAGSRWQQDVEPTNDHDFKKDAKGKAAPYGIYDFINNLGHVCVGQSYDTSEFAVDAILQWWTSEGSRRYPDAKSICILADAGGSNGYRVRAWKYKLQYEFANRHNIAITVCHYPPGASKWNPIEHRMFSQISKNWAAAPLRSYDTVLNYIRSTTTKQGLKITAQLNPKNYTKGMKISDKEMNALNITRNETLPNWSYTILPQKM